MRIGKLKIRDHYLVVGAQAAGQIALLAVIPVLSRAFTPADLGPYQIAMAIALVIQPLATLRHEWIIPVAKSAALTRRFVRRSKIAIVITNGTLLTAALVALMVGEHALSSTLLMTALICIAYTLMTVDNAVLIRSQKLKRLAVRNLISGVAASALQLMVALLAPYAILVAAAVLVGRVLAVALTSTRCQTMPTVGDGGDSLAYGWRSIATNVTSGVVVSSTLQSLTLSTGWLLGSAQAAFVATAQRISGTPASVIGQGIGQAIQASASKAINAPNGDLGRSMRRAGVRIAIFAVVVGFGMVVLGPLLAVPVLGHQWEPVGAILPIMAVPVMLQLLVNPLTPVLVMIGRETSILILSVVRLLATVGAAAATATATRNLIATVTAFSVSTVICYVLYLVVIVVCVRRFDAGRI